MMRRVAICSVLALAVAAAQWRAVAARSWYGDHGRSLLQDCGLRDPSCGACVNGAPYEFCCSGSGMTVCPSNSNGHALPPSCNGDGNGCNKPLSGITYAPFNTDPNQFCLDAATVANDLAKIEKLACSIRLYSLTACPDTTRQIIQFANDHRMTIAINAYLSKDANLNTAEVNAAVSLTKEFKDTVEYCIIGNEVVFSKQLTVDQVCGYINQARTALRAAGVNTPVGTADVWPTYESDYGKALVACQDVVYYNQQPFWEGFFVDCPVERDYPCSDAPVYTWLKVEGLEGYFKKKFVVTETGWPDAGEKCCDGSRPNAIGGFDAVPSPNNAAYYAQVFVAEARKRGRPYYYHSYEDGDWKRVHAPCGECTGLQKDYNYGNGQTCATHGCEVDYHFGLLTSNRQAKAEYQAFPLCGLV